MKTCRRTKYYVLWRIPMSKPLQNSQALYSEIWLARTTFFSVIALSYMCCYQRLKILLMFVLNFMKRELSFAVKRLEQNFMSSSSEKDWSVGFSACGTERSKSWKDFKRQCWRRFCSRVSSQATTSSWCWCAVHRQTVLMKKSEKRCIGEPKYWGNLEAFEGVPSYEDIVTFLLKLTALPQNTTEVERTF